MLWEFSETSVFVVATMTLKPPSQGLFPEGIFVCKDYVADGIILREKKSIQIVPSSDGFYQSHALAFPTCDLRN